MQTLSIRIISLDGGDGATVAVLDHFTPAVENLKMTAAEAVASLRSTPAKIDTVNAERVRQELGSVKALLAAQAGALAELHESADAQLEAARLDWQKELKSQLAQLSHTAALQLEESRKAWQAERDACAAQMEVGAANRLEDERKRWTCEAEAKLAIAQEAWKGAEAARLASIEEKWRQRLVQLESDSRSQRNFENELSIAQKAWKDGDAARFAKLEAQWVERLAQTQARAADSAAKQFETLLAKAESDWKIREEETLSEAKAAWQHLSARVLASEQERLEKDAQRALEGARTEWKTNEATRLALAEAKWREEFARLANEAQVRVPPAEQTVADDRVIRLQTQLDAANADIAVRDVEIEHARQQIATAVSEARAPISACLPDDTNELARVRDELAAAQTAISNRDAEATRVRRSLEEASEQLRQQHDMDLSEAQKIWSGEAASRLAAAQASWREQTASELAEVTARYENIQVEVTGGSEKVVVPPASTDLVEVLRLRKEAEHLRSTLAVRDVELAQARSTADEFRRRSASETVSILPKQAFAGIRTATGTKRSAAEGIVKRGLLRDMAIVAAVVAFGMLLYPHFVSLIPYDWWPGSSYSEDADTAPMAAVSATASLRPAPDLPTDIVIRAANVRSGPSKSSSLVAKLARDARVKTLERNGSWARVAFSTADAQKHQGWILSSLLQAALPANGQPSLP